MYLKLLATNAKGNSVESHTLALLLVVIQIRKLLHGDSIHTAPGQPFLWKNKTIIESQHSSLSSF